MSEKERNKKNKKKVTFQKDDKKQRKSKAGIIITSLLAAVVAINFYFTYTMYVQNHEVPKLDLDYWWGPSEKTEQNTAIRPFKIYFTDAMEEQFRRKSDAFRQKEIPQSFRGTGWSYGVNSKTLKRVLSHWIFEYKFNQRQKYFNQFEHFKTNIQGLDIHYVHVKPKNTGGVKVFPILLMHGWLGSIKEFYDVIPILTTPRQDYDFVFEVIVPSLPGFGYSDGPNKPGLSPAQAAIIMKNLMNRLGLSQYFIQGGDFGAAIGTHMATLFPTEVLGFHTNFAIDSSPFGVIQTVVYSAWKSFWDGEPFWQIIRFYIEESGYMHLQGTKPDTIGIALNESPAGLLAYILDKWQIFTDPGNKDLSDGGLSNLNTTDFIDNVMMYWAPGCITTSMRLYKESFDNPLEQQLPLIPTTVPTWVLKMKHELIHQPDFILRRKFTNLLGSTEHDFGGHFAAFERPKEFSEDVFKSVEKFLEFYKIK